VSAINETIKRILKDQFCDNCFYKNFGEQQIWRLGDDKPEIIKIICCRLNGSPPCNLTCKDWKDEKSSEEDSILIG